MVPWTVKLAMVMTFAMLAFGCGVRDEYGRSYTSPGELNAASRAELERLVRDTQPLPSPLAAAARVTVPNREHVLNVVRRANPGQGKEFHEANARNIEQSLEAFSLLIEKRRIFSRAEFVRTDTHTFVPFDTNTTLSSEAYLVEVDFGYPYGTRLLASRPNSQSKITLPRTWIPSSNEYELHARMLKAVEDFVRQEATR